MVDQSLCYVICSLGLIFWESLGIFLSFCSICLQMIKLKFNFPQLKPPFHKWLEKKGNRYEDFVRFLPFFLFKLNFFLEYLNFEPWIEILLNCRNTPPIKLFGVYCEQVIIFGRYKMLLILFGGAKCQAKLSQTII